VRGAGLHSKDAQECVGCQQVSAILVHGIVCIFSHPTYLCDEGRWAGLHRKHSSINGLASSGTCRCVCVRACGCVWKRERDKQRKRTGTREKESAKESESERERASEREKYRGSARSTEREKERGREGEKGRARTRKKASDSECVCCKYVLQVCELMRKSVS